MKALINSRQAIMKALPYLFSFTILLLLASYGFSQTNNPNQYPERTSQSQQSSDYLHNFEKNPNGVPDTAAWYAQPWIWSIVAAILVLIIGWIYKNNTDRDDKVETGLRNQ